MKTLILFLIFSISSFSVSDRSKMHWKSYKVENCYFNTRELILLENGENVKTDCTDKKNGKVISGIWKSFYSAVTITDPKKIQIDHVLPYAWHYNNANDKSTDALLKFYNDQENLVITTIHENESKGDNLDLPFDVDFQILIAYKLTQCRTCKKYQDSNCKVVCGGVN